jgi:hypothetical protein
MKIGFKTILFWVVSLILMFSAYMYQKITGPTYPVSGDIEINSQTYKYKLPRTSDEDNLQLIEITLPDKSVSGTFIWKRFKSNDTLTYQPMERRGDKLIGKIPHQPSAGKVQYDIVLKTVVGDEIKLTENPIVLRYKGKVPVYWLIPHIFCMFFGFWFAVRTGMEAVAKRNNLYKLTLWTTILLFFGGIILGPVIQKYAFGAFWTGWPFGHDLTDNKTLVAFIMWVVALWKMRKNKADRKWAIIAALVTLAVFIVPHSVLGSEIDYTKIQKP